MVVRAADDAALAQAVALLQAGEVVGLPTETVYGLAADAVNPQAVARIFALKGRPLNHPVIVHVADAAASERWTAPLTDGARRLMDAFWPGPLTLILPRAAHVADAVTGGQDTVGLRCPAHPVAQAVLRAFERAGGSGGLAAPSANRFGRISPTRAAHVQLEFGEAVPLVLDGGACAVGIESTILDLSRDQPVLLRPGAILPDALAECLGMPVLDRDARAAGAPAPRVSGALVAHYAPRTPLRLASGAQIAALVQDSQARQERVAVWAWQAARHPAAALWREAPSEPAEYAHALYATLRELDDAACDLIVVQTPPSGVAWQGVHDRLSRAQVGSGPGQLSS